MSCSACAVVDYDEVRLQHKRGIAQQIEHVRAYVAKLQKAQRAAEKTMDMYLIFCACRDADRARWQVSQAVLSMR